MPDTDQPIRLRPAASDDLDLVCRHRERMFREAGHFEDVLLKMAAPFRRWLEPRLRDGRYTGFIATKGAEEVGGIGLMELDWPPHPSHPEEGRRGYVLNVYVEPEHRGAGVATRLMVAADEEFARRSIGFAVLHATTAGRPLYERLGWERTAEMARVPHTRP